jgi:hypothetical protein
MIPIGKQTYLYTTTVETTGRYNLSYGDDIECKCDILIIDISIHMIIWILVVASIVVVVNLKLSR